MLDTVRQAKGSLLKACYTTAKISLTYSHVLLIVQKNLKITKGKNGRKESYSFNTDSAKRGLSL